MARYGEYIFNYPVDIPGDEYTYSYSHPPAQTRLYPTNPHVPAREGHRSLSRYETHANIVPDIQVSRPGQTDYIHISPIDARSYSQYGQQYQPHYPTSEQAVSRSPTNYGTHYVDGPYYTQNSNATDSSDESSSSPLSRSYERIRHPSIAHTSTKSRSQRYYCEFEDCIDKDTGKQRSLGRKADLKRHILTVHGEPKYNCPMPRCNRKADEGFCRKDHMNEHLRTYHNRGGGDRKEQKNPRRLKDDFSPSGPLPSQECL